MKVSRWKLDGFGSPLQFSLRWFWGVPEYVVGVEKDLIMTF